MPAAAVELDGPAAAAAAASTSEQLLPAAAAAAVATADPSSSGTSEAAGTTDGGQQEQQPQQPQRQQRWRPRHPRGPGTPGWRPRREWKPWAPPQDLAARVAAAAAALPLEPGQAGAPRGSADRLIPVLLHHTRTCQEVLDAARQRGERLSVRELTVAFSRMGKIFTAGYQRADSLGVCALSAPSACMRRGHLDAYGMSGCACADFL